MEPHVSGAATLSKVTVSSLALMKIVQNGTKSMPELCAGCLMGMDDGKGGLEITDVFAYPVAATSSNSGGNDGDDDEQDNEADIAEYREEMLKLLRDCNMDDLYVGWYRTVNMGDFCDLELLEQFFIHQEECDQATGKAKSCMIVYDPFQTEKGVLSIKALRLTDAFMEVMRYHSPNTEARIALQRDAALSKFKMSDIFYEIPIEIVDSSTLGRLALTELTVGGESAKPSQAAESGFDRLALSGDPYLEKNVALAITQLDALQGELQRAKYFQTQLQKFKQQQEAWIVQRKMENAARAERGEEQLPLRDPNHPAFSKVPRDTSKLGSLLVRKQADIYCDQINEWSAQSLEKLFLLNSVQQQQ